MSKARIAVWVKIDGERVVPGLQEASERLDKAEGEVVLDFSSVCRIGPGVVREMEKLAAVADDKAVKVGLRGVHIDVYKVLKLVKLSPRFSFLT